MPVQAIPEPLRAYNFAVDIDGAVQGYFSRISGLQTRIEAIDYREGGAQNVQKLRGRVSYGEVELWWGVTTNATMWQWMEDALKRDAYKKNLSIVLLDQQRQKQVVAWNLINAWPSHWQIKPLDGLSTDVAFESLTLSFDYFERVTNG